MGVQPVYADGDDELMLELRQQVRITPPLRAGEQEVLLERSARGDRRSQERLVAVNLGMVIRLAEARDARGLSVVDLVQEGSIGLVEAIRTFHSNEGAEFVPFAEQKVSEQMEAAITAEGAAVRDAEQLVTAASDYERTEILLHK